MVVANVAVFAFSVVVAVVIVVGVVVGVELVEVDEGNDVDVGVDDIIVEFVDEESENPDMEVDDEEGRSVVESVDGGGKVSE